MFFIEWRPDLYGEEISDVDILNSRGFMAIDEDSEGPCEELAKLPCSPLMRQLSHAKVFKDWEVNRLANRNLAILCFLFLIPSQILYKI